MVICLEPNATKGHTISLAMVDWLQSDFIFQSFGLSSHVQLYQKCVYNSCIKSIVLISIQYLILFHNLVMRQNSCSCKSEALLLTTTWGKEYIWVLINYLEEEIVSLQW